MSLLHWGSSWVGMRLVDNVLTPNNYNLNITFSMTTDDVIEQGVAFERIKFWVENVLPFSMFSDINNPMTSQLHQNLDTLIISTPGTPIDGLLSYCLLNKLIAITEGRALIHGIELSSTVGSDIVHSYDPDDLDDCALIERDLISEHNQLPWWNRTDIDPTDTVIRSDSKLEIILDRADWESVNLGWDQVSENKSSPAQVIPLKGWKPTIIVGGKNENE